MNSDKSLEDVFLAQTPRFTDNDAFMASLTKRLDAVEYVKRYQEATLRRYKMMMLAAFVVGIISGALAVMYVLSTPADVPLFTFRMHSAVLSWLSENSRIIMATTLAFLITLGLISIVGNVQDIVRMRAKEIEM